MHTLGDTEIVADLRLSRDGLAAGVAALRRGCTVYTDTRMAAAGLPLRRLTPLSVTVTPLMGLPGLEEISRRRGVTRSRAGIDMIADRLAGQIMVIGNAPTALLALLEALSQGAPAPALVVGMPVGFVNAAQSKELLWQSPWPHFTLLGRKGGFGRGRRLRQRAGGTGPGEERLIPEKGDATLRVRTHVIPGGVHVAG